MLLRSSDRTERRATNVEFGLIHSGGIHELYFTVADGLGRSHAVYRCALTVATLRREDPSEN